jgi:hypothetical protein
MTTHSRTVDRDDTTDDTATASFERLTWDSQASQPEATHRTESTDAAEEERDRWPAETDVTAEQLYNELAAGDGDGADALGVRTVPEQRSEVLLHDVLDRLFDAPEFTFEESTVKENLDEILLLLVAHRRSGTHGKGLMGDLAALFDTHLSPGTLYPRLHDLEDDGLLRVQELVRTKEYQVDDVGAIADRVEAAMEQHLVLALFLKSALADLS